MEFEDTNEYCECLNKPKKFRERFDSYVEKAKRKEP